MSPRLRTSSKWARKSKRVSSRWTRSSAASGYPSKQQIIPKNNSARKSSRSTRYVPAKTWLDLKKLSPLRNRKNIAPANPNVSPTNRANQTTANLRRNQRRNSSSFPSLFSSTRTMRAPHCPRVLGQDDRLFNSMLALGLGLFRYSLWQQDRQGSAE